MHKGPLTRLLVLISFFVLGSIRSVSAAPDREKIFKEALEFTVFIEQVTTIPFNGRDAGYSTGSGFVMDKKKGLIVTNAHVASEGVGTIKVRFENREEYDAEVVYVDSKYDIAVIRIDPSKGKMPIGEAHLGNSDKVDAGRPVGTFGNPASFSFSATAGIVSATDRTDPNLQFAGEYFQTDAAISRGNSGGPLIDLTTGEIIGINTWVWIDERGNQVPGLGFSLKMNVVRETLDRIRSGKEKPVVGWIGLGAQEIPRQRAAENYGLGSPVVPPPLNERRQYLVVTSITQKSPAETAGFQKQDLILNVEGRDKLTSLAEIEKALNTSVGKELKVDVLRHEGSGFVRKMLRPVVYDRNQDRVARYITVSGMAAHHLTVRWREEFSIPPEGVLVSYVQEGSHADLAGLQALDIIHGVNGQAVKSLDDLWSILTKIPANKRKAELLVRRYRQYRPDKLIELEIDLPELKAIQNH